MGWKRSEQVFERTLESHELVLTLVDLVRLEHEVDERNLDTADQIIGRDDWGREAKSNSDQARHEEGGYSPSESQS